MENAPQTIVRLFTSIFGENPSGDFLLLLVLVGAVLALSFWGRSKIIAIIISVYVTIALLQMTAISGWMNGSVGIPQSALGNAGIMFILVAIIFGIVQYSFGYVLRREDGQYAKSVILATSVAGLLASFWLTNLPSGIVSSFSPLTISILASNVALFAWILAPVALIGITED